VISHMKFNIERTGGMSPTINVDIDTQKLSEQDRKKFYDILRDSKLFESPPKTEPPGADFPLFKIEAAGFVKTYAGGLIYNQIRALIELAKSQETE
jgi:hypothetical protein